MSRKRRRHMRKAQQYLNFASGIHDMLFIIGRHHPTVEKLQRIVPKKRELDEMLSHLRRMRLIRTVRLHHYEPRIFVTEYGYAMRGFLEDHWEHMTVLSHFTGDRLPARGSIEPIMPVLLSESNPRYRRIKRILERD
jgi:hypothetical protein